MELFDVVMKLTGSIEPVGETHTDDKRFVNLQVLLKLMRELHIEVERVATENKERQEFSMARAGKECDEYLDWLGIPDA